MENSLLSLYLPEGLVEQFDISYMCSFCKRDTKEEGYIIQRDLSFLTSGIKMTTDLSAFLKGTNRDPRRYDVEYL